MAYAELKNRNVYKGNILENFQPKWTDTALCTHQRQRVPRAALGRADTIDTCTLRLMGGGRRSETLPYGCFIRGQNSQIEQ
ncbi:hypothetical protein RR48_14093 [Papilio machaon]|uniref:Uncharacterized protein n=1 Tax=Papilio machaon TaxID=76193 RepID=A0A194QLW5_PAPMA|nr:hypothetical protein RR48_14093 [Papilio machaon]